MVVFSTVPAFDWVVTIAQSGVMTPPFIELSRTIPVRMPVVGIMPLSLQTITTLFESTSISTAEISSIMRLGVEHMTLWCIAPLSGVIFLNQQY